MNGTPPYCEQVRLVEMGPLLGPAYRAFEQATTKRVEEYLAQDDMAPLIPWFKALLIYADMPWLGWTCRARDGEVLGSAPVLPYHTIYPLEQALIDYVGEQARQGLPTIVFTENTGSFDDQERLKGLIEQHVRGRQGSAPGVAILRGAMAMRERQAWIESCARTEVNVLICYPAFIGDLDLAYFKRIAFKRIPTQREDLHRAARCLLGPAQDTAAQTAFFAYEESMALRLLMHRARTIHGKLAPVDGLVLSSFDAPQGDTLLEIACAMIEAMKRSREAPLADC